MSTIDFLTKSGPTILVGLFFIVLAISRRVPSAAPVVTPTNDEDDPDEKNSGPSIAIPSIRYIVPRVISFRNTGANWVVNVPLIPLIAPLWSPQTIQPVPPKYKNKLLATFRDQGSCGTCWCFSLVDSFAEIRARINNFPRVISLSVQQVINCAPPGNDCTGGSPEVAAYAMLNKWITTEKLLPYEWKNGQTGIGPCPTIDPTKQKAVRWSSVWKITDFDGKLEDNIARIKQAILTYGSCYCIIVAFDDLLTYQGTVPYSPDPAAQQIGGHAIRLVGFNSVVTPGYWISESSWGPSWPVVGHKSGQFRLVMGTRVDAEKRCGFVLP